MKKNLINLALSLMTILTCVEIALAGETISFSVSCRIPAIPGVNAPPFAEGKTAGQEELTQEKQTAQAQQEDKEELLLTERETSAGMVRTVYSR
jgi:hypothetical protein